MITVEGINKKYKGTQALEDITLDINKGETFGLLGPNGSGKTTLLMILSTLLEPTSGSAVVNGHDLLKNPALVKKDLGIIFQETTLDDRLTGRENLEIQSVLYDIPANERRVRIMELLDFVGLRGWADTHVKKYSGGMKRRLEIARCLIHKPRILILDEPTLGLDPKARETVWEYLEKLEGITVILATNYIEEADALCDRVAIIDGGRIIKTGSPDKLKSSIGMERVQIRTGTPDILKKELEKLDYIDNVSLHGSVVFFSSEHAQRKDLMKVISTFSFDSLMIRKTDLSDVFHSYAGRSIDIPLKPDTIKHRGRRRQR